MNDPRLKKLFELARGETPPAASEGFDARVLANVRREQRASAVSWWDQLGELFPRLAVASVTVMCVCALTAYFYTAMHPSSLTADLSEISDQWQLADNGD